MVIKEFIKNYTKEIIIGGAGVAGGTLIGAVGHKIASKKAIAKIDAEQAEKYDKIMEAKKQIKEKEKELEEKEQQIREFEKVVSNPHNLNAVATEIRNLRKEIEKLEKKNNNR